MTGSPTTLLARWPSANPSSAIPLLARALTNNTHHPSINHGRRAVQIRSLRLPASDTAGKDGRNMYIVRTLEGTTEDVALVVEDPSARGKGRDRKGKGKAKQEEDDDEVMIVEDTAPSSDYAHAHGQWTFSTLALPPGSSPPSSSGAVASIFDTFIQRALFAPPQPGAPPGQQAGGGFWQPRNAAVSIEGFSFSVGAAAGATSDWTVKVGSVLLKGGASAGQSKGCIIEVTYLPVPYLPANSTYVKDFLLSLFPAPAVRNGEIEVITLGEDTLEEAGLLDPRDPEKGEEEGEWEWQEKHSTFAYVHQFKKEGIL
ncbi:hypothetical protein JCM8097_003403 [Rhodosporidiobolus ruineniae]